MKVPTNTKNKRKSACNTPTLKTTNRLGKTHITKRITPKILNKSNILKITCLYNYIWFYVDNNLVESLIV